MKKDIFYVTGNFYVGQRGNQQILDVSGKETLIDSNVLFVRDDDGRFVRAPDYCGDEARCRHLTSCGMTAGSA